MARAGIRIPLTVGMIAALEERECADALYEAWDRDVLIVSKDEASHILACLDWSIQVEQDLLNHYPVTAISPNSYRKHALNISCLRGLKNRVEVELKLQGWT